MKHLVPCPACTRHVRVSESACPFCDAALDLGHIPEPALPTRRLSRVALVAFTSSLALGACGGNTDSDDGSGSGGVAGASSGGSNSGGDSGSGGFGNSATLYGLPPPEEDAAIGPMYGIPAIDAGPSTGGFAGMAAMYGDPPPPVDAAVPDGGNAIYGAPPPPPHEE